MIISCNNCSKKFEVDSNIIPEKGRLLQCNGCNHKWFFKKEILENTVSLINDNINNDSINIFDRNSPTNNTEINPSDPLKQEVKVVKEENFEEKNEIDTEEESEKKIEVNNYEEIPLKTSPKKQKKFKILNIFLVAIISFVAFVIIVDTFQNPIQKAFPNIEFILYNLYESIKDISLFIRDLI